MIQRTLSYSISLLLCLFLASPIAAQNTPASKNKKERSKKEIEYPLFNGVNIGVDLWGPGSKLFGGDYLNTEVSANVDLKHRFFPTVEVGYGHTDSWNDSGLHYKSAAPYFRIGMDYNALYKKAHGHMILIGARYATSSFNYSVSSMEIEDPIYGGSYNPNITDDIYGGNIPYSYSNMKGAMHWLEINLGIRANIWKSISMGWSVRLKYRLAASTGAHGDPWFIPGFGTYNSSTIGINYSIIYKLPF